MPLAILGHFDVGREGLDSQFLSRIADVQFAWQMSNRKQELRRPSGADSIKQPAFLLVNELESKETTGQPAENSQFRPGAICLLIIARIF